MAAIWRGRIVAAAILVAFFIPAMMAGTGSEGETDAVTGGHHNKACGVGAFRRAFRMCQIEVINTIHAPLPLTVANCCLLALDAARGCRLEEVPIDVCSLPDPLSRLLLVKSNCPTFCP